MDEIDIPSLCLCPVDVGNGRTISFSLNQCPIHSHDSATTLDWAIVGAAGLVRLSLGWSGFKVDAEACKVAIGLLLEPENREYLAALTRKAFDGE